MVLTACVRAVVYLDPRINYFLILTPLIYKSLSLFLIDKFFILKLYLICIYYKIIKLKFKIYAIVYNRVIN